MRHSTKISFLLIFILTLFLTGCEPKGELVKTSEQVSYTDSAAQTLYAAEFGAFGSSFLDISSADAYGGTVYLTGLRQREADVCLEVWQWDTADASRSGQVTADSDSERVIALFQDVHNDLYWLGSVENGRYAVRKYGRDRQCVWEADITDVFASPEEAESVVDAAADAEGNIWLLLSGGTVYVADAEGRRLCAYNDGGLGSIVSGGDGRAYLVRAAAPMTRVLEFYCLDAAAGVPTDKYAISFENSSGSLEIMGAAFGGLLIKDPLMLYRWDAGTQEMGKIFGWNDALVNIMENNVVSVSQMGGSSYLVITYDFSHHKYEYASVTERRKEEFPEKTIVTLGVTDICPTDIKQLAIQFNRRNLDTAVQLVFYETKDGGSGFDAISRDLINQCAPDIIDIKLLDRKNLDAKGVLEDLTPFFEGSGQVREEDLLECIWDEGMVDGKMVSVIPSFQLSVCAGRKDNFEDKMGWTIEELQALTREHPGVPLLNGATDIDDLYFCLRFSMDKYIDATEGSCNFLQEDFYSLLTWIKELQDRKPMDPGPVNGVTIKRGDWTPLIEEEYLIDQDYVIFNYDHFATKIPDEITWFGYPTADGTFTTEIIPTAVLAVNSGSDKKDNAWEVLEYLLSSKFQGEYLMQTPVRKELHQGESQEYLKLLEAGRFGKNANAPENPYRMAYYIIVQEAWDYFNGERTVEETSEMIQNRVQLFLMEKDFPVRNWGIGGGGDALSAQAPVSRPDALRAVSWQPIKFLSLPGW